MGFPELALNRASISVRLLHETTSFETQLSVERADLRCTPKSQGYYQIKGSAEITDAGILSLHGDWDLTHQKWELNGRMENLPAGKDLLELITDVAPESKEKLTRVDDRWKSMFAPQPLEDEMSFADALESPSREIAPVGMFESNSGFPRILMASHQETIPRKASGSTTGSVPDFGLSGEMKINFRVSQAGADQEIDFKVLLELIKGQLENPLLPFPLRDVQGKVYLDRNRILVRDVTAVNGETKISMESDGLIHGLTTPGSVSFQIESLPINPRLKKIAPEGLHKLYDQINPTGLADIAGTIKYDGFGSWSQDSLKISIREGTATYEKFPYPIHDIKGSIVPLLDESGQIYYQYNFEGTAGRQPVELSGWTRPKDQGGATRCDLKCEGIPIDETFLSACRDEVQTSLRALNLRGIANLKQLKAFREPGEEKPFEFILDLEVSEARCEFERFPYPVQDLTGLISFDSREDVWYFKDLKGYHGEALLTASGTYSRQSKPDRLEMTVVLSDAPLDHQLEHAMRENFHRVWEELAPTGRATARAIISWIPSRDEIEVELPSIFIHDGTLLLKEFRYPLENVEASLSYRDGRVEIKKVKATHDETRFQAEGEYLNEPDDLWRLRFHKLIVDDLLPDRHFRKALPEAMRGGLDSLAPQGRVSLQAKLVEFRGSNRPNTTVTAAWDLDGYIAGIDFFAGLEISNAHGMFNSHGRWDGRIVDGGGSIDLDSAICLDQQLTQVRGPYRVLDREIIIGSREAIENKPSDRKQEPNLTARAIGGLLRVDAKVLIGEERQDEYGRLIGEPSNYRVRVNLSGGRLEEFARRNLSDTEGLRGVMNGELYLQGTGEDPKNLGGWGSLKIRPAALYELPVMLQVFQRLNIVAPPDNRAFDEAVIDFEIGNERFKFSKILLLGNTLSLAGTGTARFDGMLDLTFYSIDPKYQLAIPILREIISSANHGLVAVSVKGPVNNPVSKVKTNFILDNAVLNLLDGFKPFAPLNQKRPPARPNANTQLPIAPRR